MDLNTFFSRTITSVVLAASLSGCLFGGGGGGSISTTTPPGGGPVFTPAAAITDVYPTSGGSSWAPLSFQYVSGTMYVKGHSLTITGTCARGTYSVQMWSGASALPEVAVCDGLGNFSWSTSTDFGSGAQTLYTLTAVAYDQSGTAYQPTTTVAYIPGGGATSPNQTIVYMDDLVPTPAPALAASNPVMDGGTSVPLDGVTNTYKVTSGATSVTVSGTNSADTYSVVIGLSGITVLTNGGTTWTGNYVIPPPGGTITDSICAYDRAGNKSCFNFPVSNHPSYSMKLAAVPGKVNVPASAGASSAISTMDLHASFGKTNATDGGASGFKMDLGFKL